MFAKLASLFVAGVILGFTMEWLRVKMLAYQLVSETERVLHNGLSH